MELHFIFPAGLFAYIFIYAILVGGYRGSVKQMAGHSLLAPTMLWLTGGTTLLYFAPQWLGIMPALGAFKLICIGYFFYQAQSGRSPLLLLGAFAALCVSFFALFLIDEPLHANQGFSAGMLVSCMLLLLWNEALYRESGSLNTPVKPLFFATMVFLLADVIWLTDALIDGKFSTDLFYLRGMVALLMAPFLLKGLLAFQRTPLQISLSRGALFHSSILMVCGVYLLMIGATSSLLQFSGVDFRSAGDIIILSVILTPLSVFFMSTRLRRLIRVKISKHLFSEQFDYRKLWLQFASLFHEHKNSSSESTFAALLELLHHQQGCYCVISKERVRVVTAVGPSMRQFPEIKPLIGFLTETGWVLDAEEAFLHHEAYPEHIRKALLKLGMRWVIPVIENKALTAVLCIDKPDQQSEPWLMNWELKDFLLTIAKQWHWHWQAKTNAEQLSQQARLSTFTQMAAFVLHDLKNIDAQIGMLADNGRLFQNDPDFVADAFSSIDHIHGRLKKILKQLSAKQYSNTFQHQNDCSIADLKTLITQSAEWASVTTSSFPTQCEMVYVQAPLDKLQNVLSHLLRNAIEACQQTGRAPHIEFSCFDEYEDVIIQIRDNGCGMSESFVQQRLFKPLETTKGNAGMGLGVFDAQQFALQCGGFISVKSALGSGTEFSLTLPKGTGA